MRCYVFTAAVIMAVQSVAFAQTSPTATPSVLMHIDGQAVTVPEFKAVYEKNNQQARSIDPKSVDEYLDMFINFKLKVREAEKLGMDTSRRFNSELSGYRRQLAKPYLTDERKTEAMLQESYERMQQEVAAVHILLKLDEDAAQEDTANVYRKIKEIADKITDEESFRKAVVKYSHDQYNEGDLGFFTVFQMVYPFETAAYNTPVGEMSDPLRTRFGYHLLFVYDKRPARGRIRVAHILARAPKDDVETDGLTGKAKIDQIYAELNEGVPFEDLVAKHSDDVGTSDKGGILPWIGVGPGGVDEDFSEKAFSLENIGDYSAPFKTQFGWHIVKLVDKEPIPSLEDATPTIKQRVTRDVSRLSKSRKALIAQLKKAYNSSFNENALKEMVRYIDDSYYKSDWTVEKLKGADKVIFTMKAPYADEPLVITQQDLGKYLAMNRTFQKESKKVAPEVIVSKLYTYFEEDQIVDYEDDLLEMKYPEFRALVQEYHDGILLFDLMDKKVWSAAVKDTTGLEAYYNAHKEEYMWPQRAEAFLFQTNDKKIAKQVCKKVKKLAKKDSLSLQKVFDAFNTSDQMNVFGQADTYQEGEHDYLDTIAWKEKLYKPVMFNEQYHVAYIADVLPPQPKKLSEARGLVTSDYQKELEAKWIEELRAKYEVTVYEPAMQALREEYKE